MSEEVKETKPVGKKNTNRAPLKRINIVFTQDGFGYKKGDTRDFDPVIAYNLVIIEGLARYSDPGLQKDALKMIKKVEEGKKLRQERYERELAIETKRLKKLGYKKGAEEAAKINLKSRFK